MSKRINEATGTSGDARGSYVAPLQPGVRYFKKNVMGPFTEPVSKYKSPDLEYDSYDGKMERNKKQIGKEEKIAKKIYNYIKNNPQSTSSDEDGNPINQFPGKNKNIVPIKEWIELDKIILHERTTQTSSGTYNGPISIGLKKWKKNELGPFDEFVDTEINHKKKQKTLKNNRKTYIGHWEPNSDGSYKLNNHDAHNINEDLTVWFGTKKKPKGSKQPKGPWVNICRKVDGKHPPCGRPDTDKGAYPKCRAAGVAGKMSDSAKRAACAQKRKAEKKDTQTGKGQKPVMTSYKPKKKRTQNESLEKIIKNILSSL